ncbi:MAG: hypothetical protein WC543_00965 [Candidatus Omnitrophota bacterium]
MRVFKSSIIIMGLILVFCLKCSCLLAATKSIPLPADSVKISQEDSSLGPFKSTTEVYQSFLSQKKLEEFFKKEMKLAGWEKDKKGIFVKDDYKISIIFGPVKTSKGATLFLINNHKDIDQQQLLAERKIKPDKLSFMPIYPQSVQNFLWDTPTGVMGSYETTSSIYDAVFFYKSSMLNYGWTLYSEIPIKETTVKEPIDERNKMPTITRVATLRFNKKTGESCFLMFNSISGNLDQVALLKGEQLVDPKNEAISHKTNISVAYNEGKKNNK